MQCSLAARQPLLRASWPTGGPPAASCSLVSCPRGFGRPLTLGSSSHALRQLLLAAAAAGGGGGPPRPVPPPPQQTAASTSSSDGDEEEARPGLFANILKPLSDFGIGRTSMVQGGVGLFIFSGIGERRAQGCGTVGAAQCRQLLQRGRGAPNTRCVAHGVAVQACDVAGRWRQLLLSRLSTPVALRLLRTSRRTPLRISLCPPLHPTPLQDSRSC